MWLSGRGSGERVRECGAFTAISALTSLPLRFVDYRNGDGGEGGQIIWPVMGSRVAVWPKGREREISPNGYTERKNERSKGM